MWLGEVLPLPQDRTMGTTLDSRGTSLVPYLHPSRKLGPIKAWGPMV